MGCGQGISSSTIDAQDLFWDVEKAKGLICTKLCPFLPDVLQQDSPARRSGSHLLDPGDFPLCPALLLGVFQNYLWEGGQGEEQVPFSPSHRELN